jgi:uncharacterized paraquat-inducible protein A
MYCSSCGEGLAQTLSYCNHCGAKLSAAKSESIVKSSELFPDSLIWAIVSVFIIGIGSIIALMAVMKRLLDASSKLIFACAMMTFVLTFLVEGVFIRLLLCRMRDAKKRAGEIEQVRGKETKELEMTQVRARALPEPVPSVTEQTTRAFEPIYSERRPQ